MATEPMLIDQWYMRADVLTRSVTEVVEDDDTQSVPKQYKNVHFSWMHDV